MRKTMVCKSAPEIEISIDGGDSVLLRFDISCLAELQEMDGGLTELFKKSIVEQAACVLYAAGKNCNDGLTPEDARKMISCMDIASVNEILNTFMESTGTSTEANTELAKKILAQMLR